MAISCVKFKIKSLLSLKPIPFTNHVLPQRSRHKNPPTRPQRSAAR